MLLSEAFRSYTQDVIVFANQSPKTEENHLVCLRALLLYFGDIQIESLTFPMIRSWKIQLEKSRSPSTVRNYVIRLRVVLAYMEKQGYNVTRADTIPVPKRVDHVPSHISKQEVAQLIQGAVRLRSKCIISLLYASGVRVTELCNLNISDIHNRSFTVVGKGGYARLCFIDDRTQKLLDKYLATRTDNNPALFLSQTGVRLSATNVQLVVRLAASRAGLSKSITPHTLRHTFATELLRSNTNMRYVQALLGHRSLQTTQMYTHIVDRDLESIYRTKHKI